MKLKLRISSITEILTAPWYHEWIMIDTCCRRQNCSPLNLFFERCIDYVDIAWRSSARVVNQNTVGEDGDFEPLCTCIRENISQTVSNTATFTINRQQEIAYRWFAVDFFAIGPSYIPLRQLGFRVSSKTANDMTTVRRTDTHAPWVVYI